MQSIRWTLPFTLLWTFTIREHGLGLVLPILLPFRQYILWAVLVASMISLFLFDRSLNNLLRIISFLLVLVADCHRFRLALIEVIKRFMVF